MIVHLFVSQIVPEFASWNIIKEILFAGLFWTKIEVHQNDLNKHPI